MLTICLVGFISKNTVHNRRNGSFVLILILSMFGLVFDVLSYQLESAPEMTVAIQLVNIVAFLSGSLLLFPFVFYLSTFVHEQVRFKKFLFALPVAIDFLNCAYIIILGLTGRLFSSESGNLGIGAYPTISGIIFVFMLIYFPLLFLFRIIRVDRDVLITISIFVSLPLLSEIYNALVNNPESYTLVACSYSELLIYIVLQRDVITEHKRALKLAQIDSLTGIGNRFVGTNEVKKLINEHSPFTFILFDVDKFKDINDNYGHPVGDEVLIAIAEVMKEIFVDGVPVRLGGDEFFAIVNGSHTDDEISQMMPKFFSAINDIKVEGIKFSQNVSVSAGISRYDGTSNVNFDNLYHSADHLLYQSKQHKGCYYSI